MAEKLPPGVVRDATGKLIRRIPRMAADGSEWTETRLVAETLEEAKLRREDFYHPELGWIREGYKLERDRATADILADSSEATPDPSLFPTPINR